MDPAAADPSRRDPTAWMGLLEVEGESDVWGPHVSEWRERSSRGCFGPYGRCVLVYGLTVGPDTERRRKWQVSGRRRIVMASFRIGEL